MLPAADAFLLRFRAIIAFALEKYPDQSTVVSAIINMWRTCGGFAVGYFQPSWIERDGIAAVFATQAGLVAFCAVVLISPVIWLGRKSNRGRMVGGVAEEA